MRWLYWEPQTKLLDRKREEYFAQISGDNMFLFSTSRTRKDVAEPALATELLTDLNCMDSGARAFPLYIVKTPTPQLTTFNHADRKSNLTDPANTYISALGVSIDDLFYHCLAITNALTYRGDNAGALRHDWPRIPLPATRERLTASAKLGKQIARLQDTDTRVNGIDAGPIRLELRPVAVVSSADGQPLDPSADLAVTAGWGYSGTRGAIMPGHGRALERAYTRDEETAIAAWRNPLGFDLTDALPLLGETTFDIYLNDRAYWRNIPSRVWTYTMGGYPVLKKWLSYREQTVLGRPLSLDEARLFQSIARRIAALLLLEPRLDTNYHATTADLYDWSTTASPPATPLALW
jgi:hypothetical protein